MGIAVGAAALTCMTAAAVAPGGTVPARASAGQLVVGYRTPVELRQAARMAHAAVLRRLPALRVAELRADGPAALETLRRAPGIRFVQRPSARLSLAQPASADAQTTSLTAHEWQYRAIREDAVPQSVLRAAANVTIAIVDTGADVSAPDLAAKQPLAFNTRTGGPDIRDANGHGTFVASLAAGSVTNSEGILGSGGDARLVVVKSGTSEGSFTDVDEAAGIVYAIDHGARIVNLSVGGTGTSTTERRAVQYAIDHGALVVAAVGNEYADGNPVEYPAALLQPVGSNGVGGAGLAVGASTAGGGRASFSNTGSWLSLAAPGENVLGAVSTLSSPTLYPRAALAGSGGGLYGYASGTSFAAPQVAGAAALVWAANPGLTAAQVARILKQTASGGGRWTPQLGFGVVDAAAAVALAQRGAPGVLLAGHRTGNLLHLAWSGDAGAYTLRLTTDGTRTSVVLSGTSRTSTSVRLRAGHLYSFTVTALDDAGAATATSTPLTLGS